MGQGVGTIQQRIRSGPGQVRAVLTNLQKRLEEERLLALLQVGLNCINVTDDSNDSVTAHSSSMTNHFSLDTL